MCLGSTPKTDRAEADIAAFTTTLKSQAAQVFGNDDKVWNTIMNNAGPIFSASPSQQGFSAAEQNSRNALAITQGANRERFLTAAAKNVGNGYGGGNGLNISGASSAFGADIRQKQEAFTAAQLSGIQSENYAAGRDNWKTAGEMVERAPSSYNNANMFDTAIQKGQDENLKSAESQDAKGNWWVKPAMAGIGMAGNMIAPGLGTLATGVASGGKGSGGGIAGGIGNLDSTGGSSFGEQIGNFFSGMAG